MAKPEKGKRNSAEASANDASSTKYKGVRKRKWGRYVSEIRLPNCRERIWLGSYDSAEKAARAFDAALFCLRGPSAKFNFMDSPPCIPGGESLHPSEIQAVAAQYANSAPPSDNSFRSLSTSSSSSSEMRVDSPCPSVSDGPAHLATGTALDSSLLDLFSTMGPDHNATGSYDCNATGSYDYNVTGSYDLYPGFDDLSNNLSPLPNNDYYPEEHYDSYSHDSLWNF